MDKVPAGPRRGSGDRGSGGTEWGPDLKLESFFVKKLVQRVMTCEFDTAEHIFGNNYDGKRFDLQSCVDNSGIQDFL